MQANVVRRSHIAHRPTPGARPHLTVVPPTTKTRRPIGRKAARRRMVRLLLLASIILAVLFGAPKLVQTLTPAQDVPLTEHRVTSGESLWQIAAQYRPESDPRQVIAQIKQINKLGESTLQPGQHLLIPEAPRS
ncbi:MAG TPA: LysM peptidoglycan-binding domain-containing protein [Symbiobacteriaceae bacterium]|nr:LysM peptidoglycan-binding domain-containing protein [Symbiobacteriaceae bacterium]